MLAPHSVEANPNSAAPGVAREFTMRADFRRCAWYLVFGVVLILVVTEIMRANGLAPRANPNRRWVDMLISGLIVTTAVPGSLLATHTWRLRIDEIGIARRRLWWWDVWTWEEFSEGRIERQQGRFFSKSRPLWKNWLDLSLLANRDHAFVLDACKHYFHTDAPAIKFPDEPELKLTYQITKTITLHRTGITARIKGRMQELDWSQIKQIRLWRYDEWTERLRKIEFVLPGEVLLVEGVNYVAGGERRRYKPPQPLVFPPIVSDFLLKHAPDEKIVHWSRNGPPTSLAECRCRLERARKMHWRFTWLSCTVPLVMLALSLAAMGRGCLDLALGQNLFPNVGWRILAIILAVLTLGAHPLLFWLLCNHMRVMQSAIVIELTEWERRLSSA